MKSIKEIAWNVPESEYRADPAISYSQLSAFAREGPKIIPHLRDKKDTDALRFGSLVDCLLTEPETLEERFIIADLPKVSDKVRAICDKIFERTSGARSLTVASRDTILEVIESEEYYSTWRADTRIDDIIKKGESYYNLLTLSQEKTLMSTDDYRRAQSCVEVLKNHPFTKEILAINPFISNVEKIYQLKFRSEDLAETPVRCMMDFCIVNHTEKTIRPVDLKTTGKDEEHFEDSFLQWMYMIQATLYAQILQDVASKDDYFKDFTILPYWFIVINKINQTPMVWEFPFIDWQGDFRDNNTGAVYEGWRSLLHKMHWHMQTNLFDYFHETYMANGIRSITRLVRKYEDH